MRSSVVLVAWTLLAVRLLLPDARAGEWDERPGYDFFRQSTAAAPCGRGAPPADHFAWEVRPAELPDGLTLTVKQQGQRLCYVVGDRAEAPVIRVRQGQDLNITLRNEINDPAAIDAMVAAQPLGKPNEPVPIAAANYAIVPGTHHVATGATNLHVHGFAVPPVAPQDDVLTICADPAVGPGGCGRRDVSYHYRIPANMPAGLYWYHPHMHGETQAQMLMGLAGAIVVEGPEDDARRAAGIEDRVFVIRQTQDRDAKRPPVPAPAVTGSAMAEHRGAMPISRPSARNIETEHELPCSGGAGIDEITMNGSRIPDRLAQDDDMAHLEIAAGGTQLWRVLNAATDAFLNLALVDQDGGSLPVRIVARDGAPLTDDAGHRIGDSPTTEPQLVSPAGRIEFLVSAPPPGRSVYFVTRAVDTGCAGDRVPERRLALITASAPKEAAPSAAASTAAPSEPDFFSGLVARRVDRERTVAFAEYPRPGTRDETDFYIAERRPGAVLRPYEMGGPPAITVRAGTTEEWTVENWTNELHAFHIHQVHFRVLAVNGTPLSQPELRDVVTVPYATRAGGAVVPGKLRIKLNFPESLAGDIPFHCHLVDHEDNGMMAVLRVLPAIATTTSKRADLSPEQILAHPPICRLVRKHIRIPPSHIRTYCFMKTVAGLQHSVDTSMRH